MSNPVSPHVSISFNTLSSGHSVLTWELPKAGRFWWPGRSLSLRRHLTASQTVSFFYFQTLAMVPNLRYWKSFYNKSSLYRDAQHWEQIKKASTSKLSVSVCVCAHMRMQACVCMSAFVHREDKKGQVWFLNQQGGDRDAERGRRGKIQQKV